MTTPARTSFRSHPLRPILLASTILLAAYGLVIAVFSPSDFPGTMRTERLAPHLADKLLGDDTYYMMTVAWNIAAGKGIVYNFGIKTTGIQPLSTFLYAGFAWVIQRSGGDKWVLPRVVFIFGLLCLLLLGHLIGRIAAALSAEAKTSGGSAYEIGFAFTVFSFVLFRLFVFGLETGLYLVLMAVGLRFLMSTAAQEKKSVCQALTWGGLVGLTGLARIDFGLVVIVFMALALIKRKIRFSWAALAGLTAIVIVSPWFLWVRSVTGRWMPSSGLAQSSALTISNVFGRVVGMAIFLVGHATPWLYSAARIPLVLLALFSFLVYLAWLRAKKGRLSAIVPPSPNRTFVLLWTAALLGLPVVYAAFFWAQHFYDRYTSPLVVGLYPLLAAATAAGIESWTVRGKRLTVLALPLLFFITAYISLHQGTLNGNMSVAAGVIKKNFPPPSRVGAFQSGILGYFNENVLNLDGKIDHRALTFLKKHDIASYVDEKKIDILIDWPGYIRGNLPPEYLGLQWTPFGQEIDQGRILCLVRRTGEGPIPSP